MVCRLNGAEWRRGGSFGQVLRILPVLRVLQAPRGIFTAVKQHADFFRHQPGFRDRVRKQRGNDAADKRDKHGYVGVRFYAFYAKCPMAGPSPWGLPDAYLNRKAAAYDLKTI